MFACWWLMLFVLHQEWTSQSPVSLLRGDVSATWILEHVPDPRASGKRPSRQIAVFDGSVRLEPNFGWLRTRSPHHDFRLELKYRAAPNAYAGLYVRTWPRLDTKGIPVNGYEVALGDGPEAAEAGRVRPHGPPARTITFDANAARAAALPDLWHELAVECRADRVEVTVDGLLVNVVTAVRNPAGFIGLRGEAGAVDVRDVVLTPLERPRAASLGGGVRPEPGNGVQNPTLVREQKPRYTEDAMRERISGAVWLEAVVLANGKVGEVTVVRSLDPTFGLDQSAIEAVRKWKFKPGTKDGKPVAVLVTFEMTFTLK